MLVNGRLLMTCRGRLRLFAVGLLLVSQCQNALAKNVSLNLRSALAMVNAQNPNVYAHRAELERAMLENDYAGKMALPSASLLLVPRWVDKSGEDEDSFGNHSFGNDSFARLTVSQPLYDFGQTRVHRSVTATARDAARGSLLNAVSAYRLDVMRRYTDVLLADTRYLIDFEVMTLAFLRFNRLRERAELFDEVAEIDVAEKEVIYREAFAEREKSSLARRNNRIRLAAALGDSELIIENLKPPDFEQWLSRPSVLFDELYTEIEQQNPQLDEAGSYTNLARERLQLTQLQNRAKLSAELELSEYAETRGSRDDVRALLALRIPLLNSRSQKWAERQAQLEIDVMLQKQTQELLRLKQHVYAVWEKLQIASLELEAAKARVRHRDLYLDKSRALYEMEVRADIGNAQSRLLEATWLETKAKVDVMLAWAELDLLAGKPLLAHETDQTQ